MKNKIRTQYRTAVGVNYIIKNLETGEEIVASTLNNRDKDRRPWRSPAGTPKGEEFFWMKIGNKRKGNIVYIKFLNSSLFDRCLSDDGVWEFIGKRPNGEVLPKLNEKNNQNNNKTKTKKPTKKKSPNKEKNHAKSAKNLTSQKNKNEAVNFQYMDVDTLNRILGD